VTITLTPDLERALAEAAQRQGITPEMLAREFLRERLLPAGEPVPEQLESMTLAESLADFIGVLDSGEYVPGGAHLSERTGERFAELLLEKRRQGHL
jgi:hypothetical protein